MESNVTIVHLTEGKKVYTRSVGQGMPLLLLHGGPGINHESFEIFEKYVDLKKIKIIYYDQLGSKYSDKITATEKNLLTIERYVDEIEQVRKCLELDEFMVLGHSWGGILAIEYALKYQKENHLKGVVISNMDSSIRGYQNYVDVLRKKILTQEEYRYVIDMETQRKYDDQRYQGLIYGKLYPSFFCRLKEFPKWFSPPAEIVYNHFQGDNEFVVTGTMHDWERCDDLKNIKIKTLVMGAAHDYMDPEKLIQMGKLLADGETYICPNGAHFCFWDDAEHYFKRLNRFLSVV